MNKPLISVITVTYNAEQYLERTIQSVRGQDYDAIEYIVIDGASNDGTIDIIRQYADDIDFWVSEADEGIYDAMNKAIDVASGEWINFMNAGDTFADVDTISMFVERIDEDADLICGNMWRNKEGLTLRKPLGLEYVYDAMFVWHQALFTRTGLMKEMKFDKRLKVAGDYEFVLRCYSEGCTFKFIDLPIANYLEGGVSQQNDTLVRIEALYVQSRYFENVENIFKHSFYNELVYFGSDNNMLFNRLQNCLNERLKEVLDGKKFVLYGYGNIGEIVYQKYSDSVCAIVDKNYQQLMKQHHIEIFSPFLLRSMEYEYLFISVLGREDQIKQELIEEYGVEGEKVLKVLI